MRRIVTPAGWLIAIYVITVLAADFNPPPESFWERIWYETYHVLAHSFVYAVQAALMAGAARVLPADIHRRARPVMLIIAVTLILGLGQEVLQSVLRRDITVLGSGWDLLVDASGAAAGLWAYTRSGVLRSLAGFPPHSLTIQKSAH